MMKHILFVLIFSVLSAWCSGQQVATASGRQTVGGLHKSGFPGGDTALRRFLNRTMEYPPTARNANQEGIVRVNFVVRKDGRITDIALAGKAIGYGMDEEALRIVTAMPKWKPVLYKGKPVDYVYQLPVQFMLIP